MEQIIPLIIATLIPIVVLYVMRSLDLYQMGNFRNVVISFFWGIASVWLALQVNPYIYNNYFPDAHILVRYVAPVTEEILKALILLVLVRLVSFTYFVDGSIYGFAAGMGFAVLENYLYIWDNPSSGLGTAVSRVISVNLVHASATALVGIALGKSRFSRIWGQIGYGVGGLLLAMLLHGIFNNIVDREIPGPMVLYAFVIGAAATGLIAYIIFQGLAEQRRWIEDKLGMADRVTGGEARVVNKLADLNELLQPLRAQFGDEKIAHVEEFLVLQAQLGIKRKTLDDLPDAKMRVAVEKEMDEIRAKMESKRRKVGFYVMAAIRTIFPEEKVVTWGLLNSRIQQRIEERKAEGGPKVNLFANLNQRMAAAKAQPSPAASPDDSPAASSEPIETPNK